MRNDFATPTPKISVGQNTCALSKMSLLDGTSGPKMFYGIILFPIYRSMVTRKYQKCFTGGARGPPVTPGLQLILF